MTAQRFPKGVRFDRQAPWRVEVRATAALAAPLALIELAHMAIMTTDVVMMGWLGAETLAAGSLSSHYYFLFSVFGFGVLGAVAPILAQHLGARRFREVRRSLRHGAWMALLLALPCALAIWHSEAILVLLGQDPALAAAGQSYLRWMVLGQLAGFWHFLLAEFLAAHARPRASVVVTLLGIGLNALFNYTLMFGRFGFPALGLEGAGIGSALVNLLMFAALLAFVLRDRRFRRYRLLGGFWRIERSQLLEIVRLGAPIATTEVAEMGLFLVSTLLMGLIGTTALAAHAVAAQCCALAFVVTMGASQAATVRVGRAVGAGDPAGAARAGWIAIGLGLAVAVLPSLAFALFGEAIVRLFLDPTAPGDAAAARLAVSLLLIAALFQLADSAQMVARGALRGLKDTRGPMVIALVGYWGLGLPAAALLGLTLGFGAPGVWAGLALGLVAAGLLQVLRFRQRSRLAAAVA